MEIYRHWGKGAIRIPPMQLIPDMPLALLTGGPLNEDLLDATSPEDAMRIVTFALAYLSRLHVDVEHYQWFGLRIEERPRMMRKRDAPRNAPDEEKYVQRYLVRVELDPRGYLEFLDAIARSDAGLSEKYEFLFGSYWAWLAYAAYPGNYSLRTLSEHVSEYLQSSRLWTNLARELERLEEELNMYPGREERLEERLRSRLPWIKTKTGIVAWELRGAVDGIGRLVEGGLFAAVYRELRRILEDLLWALVHDSLLINSSRGHVEALQNLPFAEPSPAWFRLSEHFKAKAGWLHDGCRDKGRLDYHIAVAMLLRKPEEKMGEKVVVDCEELLKMGEPVETLPCIDVEALLGLLRERRGDGCSGELARELEGYLRLGHEARWVLPSYPTEEFMKALAETLGIIPEGYEGMYGEYSKFVHSYDATRVPAPFTSVAEAAILAAELGRFNSVLKAMLEDHLRRLEEKAFRDVA
ncbi:MAG: hypothetical protein RAK18_07620, partial [Conexivisphaerales archaeon]|nr:hypothetical protein [Conexivisphaerales archaeon]